VERHGTVSKKCLDFCYKQIALFEKIPHLEFIAFHFSTLKCVQSHRRQRKNDISSLNISTWTPPGRLTDESMRTASCRALASTFHLRGCTYLLSLCFADTMSKIRTSVIRPITRSPTSGLYLHGKVGYTGKSIQDLKSGYLVCSARTVTSLLTLSMVPATDATTSSLST